MTFRSIGHPREAPANDRAATMPPLHSLTQARKGFS